MKKTRRPIFLPALLLLSSIIMGAVLGWALSETQNIKNIEYLADFEAALPTRLLDINGELITEFASDERREIIAIRDLPQTLIDTFVTREDRAFYAHKGYSIPAIFRAVVGVLTRKSLGGGSTITQQIAGTLYADRTDLTVGRKLVELWWAMQMERRHSKDEILELYLNRVYFGGGTYGVNAAAKYYFGHESTEITPAEAAILVIQLSNPAYYNPFNHPNRAMERQRNVLDSMVKSGYLSKKVADDSFEDYWANFDFTRTSVAAYYMRDDKAPWFSEYVRRELEGLIYGSKNIYTSGFTVNTTLNLQNQAAAEEVMTRYINHANYLYKNDQTTHLARAFRTYVPFSEMLSLLYDMPGMHVGGQRKEKISNAAFVGTINPIIDISAMMFGIDSLKLEVVSKANVLAREKDSQTTIEGTMIALENETGYVTALVGGSKFEESNQYIRAVQAAIQPGSAFKPLYYSAAIDSKLFTPGTLISDTPQVFTTSDGKPYIPQNFRGEYKGDVLLWYALAHSMNVPSITVLDKIGFDAAINRSAALLGIPEKDLVRRRLIPGYTLGLGTGSVRPIELARAYAIFANGGREITPIAIRTIEDRNGNIYLNHELAVREAQRAKGNAGQVITPQTAYVMTKLLENTTESGTLAHGLERYSTVGRKNTGPGTKMTQVGKNGNRYTIPAAGKTGTTQNWKDAWAVGYSPYYTSVFWFGFDTGTQSLGTNITGSTLAGVAWGDWMEAAHKGLPHKNFTPPASGVVSVSVCSVSGMLPTEACGNNKKTLWFLAGTAPMESCSHHTNTTASTVSYERLIRAMYQSGQSWQENIDDTPLSLKLDFLDAGGTNFNSNNNRRSTPLLNDWPEDDEITDFNFLME